LDYCIKNDKNVFIKLSPQGCAVTCVDSVKGVFEYSKARNILASLPKSLKRMGFRVEAIPEIREKQEVKTIQKQPSSVVISEDITRWVDKFGLCADILNEAKTRESELILELDKSDQEFLDILHIIEIEQSKDLYNGWKLYKSIRENRERRRIIKDELLIVTNILREISPACLQRERVQRAIDGLFTRKYSFRVIEEDGNDEM